MKIAFTVLPVILLLDPLCFIVRNHPYELVYFNRFVGGVKGAFGNYDLSDLDSSKRAAAEWILADVAKNGAPDNTRKTVVATWHQSDYYFRKDAANFSIHYERWENRNSADWDYAFYAISGAHHLGLSKEAYPPKNTVHQVMVDGVPIALVLKREDRSTYYGYTASLQGNLAEAEVQFLKALDYNEFDEQALDYLIQTYSATGKPADIDIAMDLTNYWLEFHKNSFHALYLQGVLYFKKGDFANAIAVGNTITEINPHSVDGLLLVATVYAQQNNLNAAWRLLNKIITMQRGNKPAHEFMSDIANRLLGNEKAAQQVRERMKNFE